MNACLYIDAYRDANFYIFPNSRKSSLGRIWMKYPPDMTGRLMPEKKTHDEQ